MRAIILAVSALTASPVSAQDATITSGAPAPAQAWSEADGPSPLLVRAGIRVPRTSGAYAIYKIDERTGAGFDAIVNYRDNDRATATLFIYQPIHDEPALNWLAVQRAMADRINAPKDYPVGRGIVPAGGGGLAYTSYTSGTGADTLTDLAALGRTSDGWLIKLRISANGDEAAIAGQARALLAGVALAPGRTIAPPDAAPIPPCAPRAEPGRARVLKPVAKPGERLTDTLIAAISLAPTGVITPAAPRCALGEGKYGPATYFMFRSDTPEGVPAYVAALGDSGVTVSLERAHTGERGGLWWLTLDTHAERVVFQRWGGPVDDEDFSRAMASLGAILEKPIVTRVRRN